MFIKITEDEYKALNGCADTWMNCFDQILVIRNVLSVGSISTTPERQLRIEFGHDRIGNKAPSMARKCVASALKRALLNRELDEKTAFAPQTKQSWFVPHTSAVS